MAASAKAAGVSSATIRNWIKTGYLVSGGRGRVTVASLERFQKEVAGYEKLNRRANKSLKDAHDHATIMSMMLHRIETETDLDAVGTDYENHLSNAYRNKEGIYYTPEDIVDVLVREIPSDVKEASFCDPCCGSGNFIVKALSLGFTPDRVYGFDTDPVAVALTQKRVQASSGGRLAHIATADFLQSPQGRLPGSFDYIFTNPPWGKKIDKPNQTAIGRRLGAGGSLDTCSLFFFACLEALKDNGKMGLLLPESFFFTASFEAARRRALEYAIERTINFKRPFIGVMSNAMGIVLSNQRSNCDSRIVCVDERAEETRTLSSFEANPKSIFNHHTSARESSLITHLYESEHTTLKGRSQWGMGIVTGNNQTHLHDRPAPGLIPVYRGADMTTNGFNTPSRYMSPDMSSYQQTAPKHIYDADEKIIYRFISSRLCFLYDDRRRLVLNSANIVIPDADFPVNMKTLCDLFNSDFMNWVFFKLFNTHKILQTDVASLPIHTQFLDTGPFDEAAFIDKLNIEKISPNAFQLKN